MDLQLTNVINVSVSAAQSGIGAYNTSNLAIFTREEANESFGDDGYKIYLEPSEVSADFGSDSVVYQMALAAFSQQPNMLAGGGYLVVIQMEATRAAVTEVQSLDFSSVPTSGSYKLNYGALETGAIAFGDNAAAVQTALRLLAGLGAVTVAGDTTTGFDVTFTGVTGDASLLTVTENDLQNVGTFNVFITPSETTKGVSAATAETVAEAITRTESVVQYFGILSAEISSEANMDAAAAVVQTLNKIAFWPSRTEADVETGGMLDDLCSAGLDKNRGLYFGAENDTDCLLFAARYAGRALSVNFSGSNTTMTMHLKDLTGQLADESMNQTLLNKCMAAGVDTYVSLQGVPKVFCSGENMFFDRVYNRQWFIGAIEVAGFNALAQSSSKLAQTEDGVSILKAAYRGVCEQAIANQYGAPGSWNDPTTFGNQADFFRNISERGYYIYSAPVAQQSQIDRAAREAPLIQLAIKEAGAIHSSSIIIYVNA